MVAAIEQCPDITLLVWCEHVDDAKVYEQLGTLLGASATSGGNRGMFLLADAQATDATNKTFIAPTLTEPTQVATYFPALLTNYVREWSDQDVKVTGLDSEIQVTMMQLSISDSELNEPTLDTLKLTIANLTSWADPSENKALEAAQTAYAKCRELATKLAEESNPVILRASVAMAGVMARVDRERGVWKAPANVGLVGVQDLISLPQTGQAQLIRIDDTLNTTLVDSKINAIRSFRGQGVMVWGAHTMSDPKQTAWRYIPVRRLFNTVERDARATLRTVVFEPNSAPTWEAVRGALDHYLHALWRQGALQGDTPAQAYFVQIGLGTTMTQEDITNGRMIVKVGLAAVRPAEFIVLQLTQDVATA
ncbi:phage tail sheath family protein [Burkholderia stagnalis]|uniref:Phage tail sheath family protein n=2 Tax=Burkholderia stagnalis TaxID=1503054 RepID=A0ABX9YDW4_9BURK|nr:phage tail sheath family protein [Burkholderia stagnalis]RQQ59331.1 phage tail sheath family protein [Burkholderia stagnalis]RQQ59810.1 phage tail sheath family protein [Burkholderia stagnalis]RQQ74152.1 phage tail sheath family protein [Burkholderia stagnalis]RQQ79892.1 phage tail sheath family protein [Burkholderia stagnalis]